MILFGMARPPLHHVCAAVKAENPKRITVLIGPEGDFSQAEKELIAGAGGMPVNLGPYTLRTETAALYDMH